MNITNKNVDKVYNVLLKHFNIDDFFVDKENGRIYAVVGKHKLYSLMISRKLNASVELMFKWYHICDSPTCFYIDKTFPIAFSAKLLFQAFDEDETVVKRMFVKKIIDALTKNDILLVCNQTICSRIPKISSREELMIKADLEI